MKKLIPILTVICAAITAIVATVGVITVSIATSVSGMTLVAVPVAIVAFVLSILGGALACLFRKDVLCKISLLIYLAAFIVSAIAVIIWLAVL